MKTLALLFLFCFVPALPAYGQLPINYGETLTGTISPAGEVDTYTFAGEAGEKAIIRLTESSVFPSSLMEPFVELFAPSGSFLMSDSDGGQVKLNVTLPVRRQSL